LRKRQETSKRHLHCKLKIGRFALEYSHGDDGTELAAAEKAFLRG
jgi:hypothetical protein